MKVLVSAYACLPTRGSEPGVGWRWAMEIAKLGHETHVLTRDNHREAIEAAQVQGEVPGNIFFHYYDWPRWSRFWEKDERGVYIYYPLWQWSAAKLALRLHRKHSFDLVHHVTFGSVRFPSFMGRLGIPFIFGPIGGGESAPMALRKGYPLRGKIVDFVRDVSNALVKFDPLMRMTYRQADRILVKTPDSVRVIPREQHHKAEVMLELYGSSRALNAAPSAGPLRVLYAGRFLYWKGMHLGLAAFARVAREQPGTRLTMVGAGREEQTWRNLARHLGLHDSIDWVGWVPRGEMSALYGRHDVLLFPSLHDSGGNVVMEAASHSLPIVCLDLGGPGAMVTPECAVKVGVEGKSEEDVIDGLATALGSLAASSKLKASLGQSAANWASGHEWSTIVRRVYEPATVYVA
jgi:glycosyltransferase involved in cell wall biosynthesis